MIPVDRPPIRMEQSECAEMLQEILGQAPETDKAWLVYDKNRLLGRLQDAQESFPKNAIHAVAVKANPVVNVLSELVASGAGLECASIEEVHIALAAGAEGRSIVFDSPAKTAEEIEFALLHGITLNLDNLQEVELVAKILKDIKSNSWVGVRVNPAVGEGKIAATSVSGIRSRFGFACSMSNQEQVQELAELFGQYSWLCGIHVHVGSQGCSVQQLAAGASAAVELALHVEEHTGRSLRFIDIGGGLSVQYGAEDTPVTFQEYGLLLREQVATLFENHWCIYTEFGRAIQANAGVVFSRVEYTKHVAGQDVGVLHVGADMFMRPVYAPQDWRHEFWVFDSAGQPKQGPDQKTALVGPLCFGGDVLCAEVNLPTLEAGDYVAVRDAGAYTMALWSRHCNRGMPAVLLWDATQGAMTIARRRETPQDMAQFWSE